MGDGIGADIDPFKPCGKCGGSKRVKVRGVKNGRWYAKWRRCQECAPPKRDQ